MKSATNTTYLFQSALGHHGNFIYDQHISCTDVRPNTLTETVKEFFPNEMTIFYARPTEMVKIWVKIA